MREAVDEGAVRELGGEGGMMLVVKGFLSEQLPVS